MSEATKKKKLIRLEAYCSTCRLGENGCSGCILKEHYNGCPYVPGIMTEDNLDTLLGIIGNNTGTEYDEVERPRHYVEGNIEVIDYIEDKNLGYCLGNVIKYVSRAGKKDPGKEIQDLEKARWYLDRRIKELKEAEK